MSGVRLGLWCAFALLCAAGAAADDAPGLLDAMLPLTEDTPERYLALEPGEDAGVLDAALARIFPGGPPAEPEPAVLDVLGYVAQVLRLEYTAVPLGSQVLAQGHGYCNGMALAFVALCRRLGYPARMNALFNFEWMQAHNMAEVHYGGGWHNFDPTYATFFYSAADYDKAGKIFSLKDLRVYPDARSHVFQAAERLWTGEPGPGAVLRVLPPEVRYGDYPFTLRAFYDQLLAKACPVVPHGDAAVAFPLDIDHREGRAVAIGQPDGKPADLLAAGGDGRYPRFAGVPYLGKSRLGSGFHLITLRTPGPGRYRVTYHWIASHGARAVRILPLKDVAVASLSDSGDTTVADLQVQSGEAVLLIAGTGPAGLLDAIRVEAQ